MANDENLCAACGGPGMLARVTKRIGNKEATANIHPECLDDWEPDPTLLKKVSLAQHIQNLTGVPPGTK